MPRFNKLCRQTTAGIGAEGKGKGQARESIKRLEAGIGAEGKGKGQAKGPKGLSWPSVITIISKNVITDIAANHIVFQYTPFKFHSFNAQV